MAIGKPALRYGRIIYAWIADHNGHAKLRPALILTPTGQISEHGPIIVAAITTTFPDPPPANCVQLPWHPGGRAVTRLRQRSAAVVNWLSSIESGQVVGFGGDVPTRVMNAIQQKLHAADQ
jgi:mRNA-degrading endonuclease toxin of MazEF toxin-antitoxin module